MLQYLHAFKKINRISTEIACGMVHLQGGLPYWLLHKYPDIKLRTSDASEHIE